MRQVEPELEGVQFDDRYGVIFSRYDLSCARKSTIQSNARATREDAARLGLNIVLYALQQ